MNKHIKDIGAVCVSIFIVLAAFLFMSSNILPAIIMLTAATGNGLLFFVISDSMDKKEKELEELSKLKSCCRTILKKRFVKDVKRKSI